jgi:hypothetical protein
MNNLQFVPLVGVMEIEMKNQRLIVLAIALLSCLLIVAGVLAAPPAVDWSALTSGGGSASGGAVSLDAALGQPVIGSSSAGSISLQAGFWYSDETGSTVFLPLVSR